MFDVAEPLDPVLLDTGMAGYRLSRSESVSCRGRIRHGRSRPENLHDESCRPEPPPVRCAVAVPRTLTAKGTFFPRALPTEDPASGIAGVQTVISARQVGAQAQGS